MKPYFLILILSLAFAAFGQTDKLKPEELVSKHLASIGSDQARAAVKSMIVVGNSKAAARLNYTGDFTGVAQLGSEGNKLLIAQVFNSNNYPYEKAGYDGQKLTVSPLPDGRRSLLGDFFAANDAIFKEGLIGGALSSAWALSGTAEKKPRLSYSGIKKINNRQVHELKYAPRRAGDVQISLFFEAETFRHVRTEYQRIVTPRMGARSELSIGQKERRYKLTEEFFDFKTESGLTLPHTYKIRYTAEDQSGTQWIEWIVNFTRFVFNQPIETAAFNFSATE